MARISSMPSKAIVDGFKGAIDYYTYHPQSGVGPGIKCVRKWPHYSKRKPHPAESANQQLFQYITRYLQTLPVDLVELYQQMAAGTPWTWRDFATKAYITGLEY